MRWALAGAAAITAVCYGMTRSLPKQPATRLFGVVNVSHWPTDLKTWLPLNIAACYLGFLAVCYLLLRSARPSSERVGLTWPKLIAGTFVAIGGFIGAMLAVFDGWLFGLQAFLMGGTFVLLFGGLLAGIAWLLAEVAVPWIAWLVTRAMTTTAGTPLWWIYRFFNPPPGDEDPPDPSQPS
jgi:hypothetical protein